MKYRQVGTYNRPVFSTLHSFSLLGLHCYTSLHYTLNNMAPQTASELKVLESAKRGAQAIGLVSLAVVSAPVVIIACPLLGAYEFATAYDAELYSGSKIIDGMIGGLFGVVTSPLAPFYIAWGVIEELYKQPPPKPLSITSSFQERAHRDIGLDCLNFYNIAVVGVTGTGKVKPFSKYLFVCRLIDIHLNVSRESDEIIPDRLT